MLDLLIRNAHIIDGTGTPGFIDLHTHYDGQVSWDSLLTPSAQHGVISVLMGNWGVGFAPACADSQDFLIRMLEGVEDMTMIGMMPPQRRVTTAVMGNCGVGFAPVRTSDHDRLIELMEGVEDIPGTALHEGINWQWESFEQYLGAVEARRCAAMSWASAVPITRWRRARRKSPAWPN